MDYEGRIKKIKGWFDVFKYASFKLPDGWIGGRPGEYGDIFENIKMYDDYIEITFIDDSMIMKIWGDFVIDVVIEEFEYDGIKMGTIQNGYMEISRFEKLYVEYGCGRKNIDTYIEGSVSFHVGTPFPINEKIRKYMENQRK